jgi:hypothetical protein
MRLFGKMNQMLLSIFSLSSNPIKPYGIIYNNIVINPNCFDRGHANVGVNYTREY